VSEVSGQNAHGVIVTGFSASVNRSDEWIAASGVVKKQRENRGRGEKSEERK
jgi:hypothetical protein